MQFSPFARQILSFAPIAILSLPLPVAQAQGSGAATVLSQLSAAFSGNQIVQSVQLSGSAAWYAGSLEDTGTVSLTASTNGSSQMQLSLAATGQRTETQTGAGSSATCQWAGANGTTHQVDLGNCWRPALWFLPALSLYPSQLPGYLGIVDLGSGAVGFSGNTYRHLQGQLNLPGPTGTLLTNVPQRSLTDIGLDPVTLLPAVIAYSVYPDSGAQVPVAVEVHYSNYQTVNGVQIPFLIQRYVNGSLQLQITVSSAQIN
ncbi:MAG: hypothetical protein ABR956_19075 [Terracidiphilus sp.]|jgi:hypothetical protein